MPPFIPRKRHQSTPPPNAPTLKKPKKPSLFDAVDQTYATVSVAANQGFLKSLGEGDSDTSLSDVGSSDCEDASQAKPRNGPYLEEEDDEIYWEDAVKPLASTSASTSGGPVEDLELTLHKNHHTGISTNPHDKKKGPSKIERQIRTATHCMHVQFLLFHNLTRNAWACDKKLQRILVDQMPGKVKVEVETWKRNSGIASVQEPSAATMPHRRVQDRNTGGNRGRGRGRGRGKDGVKSEQTEGSARGQRDWGRPAERQESRVPNMSRGDPVIRLLKYLAAYWRKRFRITVPGLRKQGYKSLAVLGEELTSFHHDQHDPEAHGEQIAGLDEYRECARRCEGSRDVAAQLFTALIRALGLEARLVASLQPIGFGWSKQEEASTKIGKIATSKQKAKGTRKVDHGSEDERSEESQTTEKPKSVKAKKARTLPKMKKGRKDAPITLPDDDDDEELSSPLLSENDDDDESVIDVTPSVPYRKPNMDFDKDMPFPTTWVEVISPITHEVYPVDTIVLNPAVATGQDQLAAFEPRGAKADKARQVIAYVIAFSSDGTAKDVTTRYLKRHMWPGKTKGVRMPPEKIPVLNKRGKVKYFEQYDWFKTVMSGYTRRREMRTIVDDLEDSKDLKPVRLEKKEAKDGEETLQGYKQSADFVLERHLRREEALLPGSQPVKTFIAGKGDKAKEEPVYRRKDVVICRTGESWHKEGRQVKEGEYPMKMVPIRAVTLARKREVEEAERDSGEKAKQGLYARDQTEWIIPPPIENGVIPKNAFGNIDCFVTTMVPKGAVHIPLRGTVRICKRLDIDYAEAVTGFEFGNQRAVPVITGVVVASGNEDRVIDAWEKDEEERRIKEEGKREKAALAMWRKFLMGLRIIERVREEYGEDADGHVREEMNPFTNKNKRPKQSDSVLHDSFHAPVTLGLDTDVGGFLPNDGLEDLTESDGVAQKSAAELTGGGFILDDDPGSQTARKRAQRSPSLNEKSAAEASPSSSKFQSRRRTRKPPSSKESASEASPSSPKSKAAEVAKPKRKAARKSETALKSHYFDQSGTPEDNTGSENSDSDDEPAYKPPARIYKANARGNGKAPKAKRGRPRKTM